MTHGIPRSGTRARSRGPLLALLTTVALTLGACGGLEDEPDPGPDPVASVGDVPETAVPPTMPSDVGPRGPSPATPSPATPSPAISSPATAASAPSGSSETHSSAAPPTPGADAPEPLAAPATPVASATTGASPAFASTGCTASPSCALRSPDGAFEVRLSGAGGDAADGSGGITVDFELEALSRDTTLGIDPASIMSSGGVVVGATGVRIDGGPERATIVERTLRPGTSTGVRLRFADTEPGDVATLDRVELLLHEAGTPVRLAFTDVPRGPAPSPATDCALALPCASISPDGAMTLRVDAIGLERWHHYGRLIVDWTLTGTRAAEPELADAAGATTDTGHAMEYYGIEFGGTTSRGEGPLADTLPAGGSVVGRMVFRRAPPDTARFLAQVTLAIGERGAPGVQAWRVSLENLPVTR